MKQVSETSPKYFDVFRALHRGGLSLYLNRRIFMPMTIVPLLVTFLTLMVMRANFIGESKTEPSAFIMALIQIPSDFVTGLLCAIIIFVVMNAPKKNDKDAPVMFTLNIMARKDLLVGSAVAGVAVSYFGAGLLGLMQIIFEHIKLASDNEQAPSMIHTIGFFMIAGFIVYCIRFLTLPILIIGQIDIQSFYKRYSALSFSWPFLFIKIIITFTIGAMILILGSFVSGMNGHETTTPTQMAIIDFITAFGSVVMSAWAASTIAMGVRKILENNAT